MPARPALAFIVTAALLVGNMPALAADAAEPACAPTVSMALTAWDRSIAAASAFGESAAGMAREKGREYLLPLLGIDPKTVQAQPGTADPAPDPADEVGRELEASRDDPARREALCMAITQAARKVTATAGATAEAGLDALKGALDRFLSQQPQSPQPAPQPPVGTEKDGLIRT